LNQLAADSKIPNRLTLSGIWYYPPAATSTAAI
jgi:hypothetical protein